jgi:hypothetical protein
MKDKAAADIAGPGADWQSVAKRLCWSGDIDLLMRFRRPEETIIHMTWQQAETDQRVLTRRQLRLMDRPSYSHIDDETWVAQYGEILEQRD